MRSRPLLSALLLCAATLSWAHDWAPPAVLPTNTMVELKAPSAQIDKASAPKRFAANHYSSHSPYQSVYRFKVEKGRRYTFLDCNPAIQGKEIWLYLTNVNPVSDYTYALSVPNGNMPGFAVRFQQPWPIEKNESATCDAMRHNITIAPGSEHDDLFLVVNFNRPDVVTKVMLKSPADSDQDVGRSTTSPYRPQRKGSTWGSLWPQPIFLKSIPGESLDDGNGGGLPPGYPPGYPHGDDRPPLPPVVIDPPVAAPTLEADAATYAPGAVITVRYSGIRSPAQQDWIALYKEGAKNEQYGEWHYLGGASSGQLKFKAPAEGAHEFRLFLNWPSGGYADVAKSRRILVQQAPAVEESWLDTIRSGRTFRVVFDVAPSKFNDQGWLGQERDPMGTLKGGETYEVVYRAPAWTVTGFNEGTNARGSWTYDTLQPEAFQLNLWGRGYAYSRNGEVFDYDYGLVGHLKR